MRCPIGYPDMPGLLTVAATIGSRTVPSALEGESAERLRRTVSQMQAGAADPSDLIWLSRALYRHGTAATRRHAIGLHREILCAFLQTSLNNLRVLGVVSEAARGLVQELRQPVTKKRRPKRPIRSSSSEPDQAAAIRRSTPCLRRVLNVLREEGWRIMASEYSGAIEPATFQRFQQQMADALDLIDEL